jgi:hypothetical protein
MRTLKIINVNSYYHSVFRTSCNLGVHKWTQTSITYCLSSQTIMNWDSSIIHLSGYELHGQRFFFSLSCTDCVWGASSLIQWVQWVLSLDGKVVTVWRQLFTFLSPYAYIWRLDTDNRQITMQPDKVDIKGLQFSHCG